MTQPTLFESPVVQGEVRPLFIHQNLPKGSIFGGGDFQVYALQLRVPITERLAFIATKDGYIDLNPNAGKDQEGFADVAAGLKFVAFEHKATGILVTPGFTFEVDVGEHQVFQGNGDGLLRPFVSVAWDPSSVPELNVVANVGFSLPMDSAHETQSLDYHGHVSYEVAPGVMPLVEIHGITYTRNAKALAVGFEGGDLINLGASGVAGQTVVTGAVGARFRVNDGLQFGIAWGVPLSDRQDLFKSRLTIDASITF